MGRRNWQSILLRDKVNMQSVNSLARDQALAGFSAFSALLFSIGSVYFLMHYGTEVTATSWNLSAGKALRLRLFIMEVPSVIPSLTVQS